MVNFGYVFGSKDFYVNISFSDGQIWSLTLSDFLEYAFEHRLPVNVKTVSFFDGIGRERWRFQII